MVIWRISAVAGLGDVSVKRHRLVVIGGNIAGFSAAMGAREVDKHAEIIVLSKELHPPYRRSMLSSIVAQGASSIEGIYMFSARLHDPRMRFLLGVEVSDIKLEEKTVTIEDTRTEKDLVFDYSSLVLAMGGVSPVPSVQGVEKKGVFVLRTLEDALQILQTIRLDCSAHVRAVVVGAGFAGLEIAEALARQGARVTIVIRSRILREFVEPNLSQYLKNQIEQKGVMVITGVSPIEIEGEKGVEYVRLEDDTKIPASVVVFATGVNPNVALAQKIDVELGKNGAIKVDRYMQTSIPQIHAAGDCAETLDALTGRWTYYPVGSVAAKEGIIAGMNALGSKVEFGGVIRTQMDMLFGEGIASIGHGSESAKKIGMKVDLIELSLMKSRFSFLNTCPAKIMVAVDPDDRMVGAQVVSDRFASPYAFTLLSAIQKRITLGEFLEKWQPSPVAFTNLLMKRAHG